MKKPLDQYPLYFWAFWVLGLPFALLLAGLLLTATAKADALHFDGAELWWLLAAIPVAGGIAVGGGWRRRKAMESFASAELAPLLADRFSGAKAVARATILVVAVLLIVVAVLGPRWGMYLEKQKAYGVDVVVAVDVSRSMLARDVQPSRLERAKTELRQQLTERGVFKGGSRLALLAFAGSTSLKLPLTTDHYAFRSKLEALDVGSAPRGGTAIAEAIRSAGELFSKSPADATRIILVLTDGEDHVGGPIEAAQEVHKTYGAAVFCVGVGDPARTAGAEVPGPAGQVMLQDGQIVFSKLQADALRKISEAGKGTYAGIDAFPRLVTQLGGMKKAELTVEERMRHRPQYQWFLAAAILLLLVQAGMSEARPQASTTPVRTWQLEGVT